MTSQTGLARVRGLGSAKHGSGHWLSQRMTATSNFALMIWLIVSLLRLPALDHETVRAWLVQPIVAVPMMLLILSTFYHIKLGLQVLIEDYVHDDALKLISLIALNFYCIGLGAFGIFAVAKIAFAAVAAPVTGTPQ